MSVVYPVWQGNEPVINTNAPETPDGEARKPRWGDVFNESVDVLCAIKPDWCSSPVDSSSEDTLPPAQNNSVWWILGGVGLIIVILLIVLIARK